MKNNYISEYIEGVISFCYKLSIPATSENFKKNILNFDYLFLKSGIKYKFFLYENKELASEYIQRRNIQFFSPSRQWLGLLDFEQFEDTSFPKMYMTIPDTTGEDISISYHKPFGNLTYLYISDGQHYHWSDLSNLSFWYETLSCYICSNSTIWWENIELELDEKGYPIDISPINNRFFSYRITPRFNSFLRDMKLFVNDVGGTIELDDEHHKDVTENGILLGGKIIYQEDIDEGRVKLPPFI